jgi:hypothetical protein
MNWRNTPGADRLPQGIRHTPTPMFTRFSKKGGFPDATASNSWARYVDEVGKPPYADTSSYLQLSLTILKSVTVIFPVSAAFLSTPVFTSSFIP